MKLSKTTHAVSMLFGLIDRKFLHMRLVTYLSAGGPMLTLKVV